MALGLKPTLVAQLLTCAGPSPRLTPATSRDDGAWALLDRRRVRVSSTDILGPACQSAYALTKPAISGAGTWVPHGSSTISIESHQITENRTRTDSVFFAGSAQSLTTLPPVILVAVTTAASACYATTWAQDRINTSVAETSIVQREQTHER